MGGSHNEITPLDDTGTVFNSTVENTGKKHIRTNTYLSTLKSGWGERHQHVQADVYVELPLRKDEENIRSTEKNENLFGHQHQTNIFSKNQNAS